MGVPAINRHPFLWYTILSGDRGVSVFFVISGFLITSLLLQEERITGNISLRNFYIRRAFRILPPFWIFLASLVVLWQFGALQTSWASVAVAFAFLRDYISGDWWTGHIWSLSVEEQFYLFWPATLVFIGRRRSLFIALTLILFAPAIRVLSEIFMSNLGYRQMWMFHVRVDGLMCGCVGAMIFRNPRFAKSLDRILKWPGMLSAVFFLFVLSGYLTQRYEGSYFFTFGFTLESIAILYLLLYFVSKPGSIGGRVLNAKALVHIGSISYSLYLWQQLWLSPAGIVPYRWSTSMLGKLPLNLIATFLAAECSWNLVERPLLKFRRRFENTKTPE